MPILYNFHILLATFYIIFRTNILIQCPVPVPICCMFYVSQKPHIKRSPNGIKTDGEYFWNICDISKKNQCETVPEVAARVAHATTPGGHAPHSRGPPVRRLMPFFFRKKDNFLRKIWAKDSPQSKLRIFGYCEGVESRNAETER